MARNYKIQRCNHCHNLYQPVTGRQHYCSKWCHNYAKRRKCIDCNTLLGFNSMGTRCKPCAYKHMTSDTPEADRKAWEREYRRRPEVIAKRKEPKVHKRAIHQQRVRRKRKDDKWKYAMLVLLQQLDELCEPE